jgi:uncharacterized OB-fold protein
MERHILGYACTKCKTVHYPNRAFCKKCRNETFTPVPLPRAGKLLTFTHLHNTAADFEVPVLDLGIVELENGVRMLGQLRIDHPKIGMKVVGEVAPVRKLGYTTYHGMIFHKD